MRYTIYNTQKKHDNFEKQQSFVLIFFAKLSVLLVERTSCAATIEGAHSVGGTPMERKRNPAKRVFCRTQWSKKPPKFFNYFAAFP